MLDWASAVRSIKIGKALPDAIYIHISALDLLPSLVQDAASIAPAGWNVLKISRLKPVLSCLWYSDFEDDPYPSLETSVIVDAATGQVSRTIRFNPDNPPILHKKELLLRPEDPRREKWGLVTRRDEDAGFYADSSKIGFRRSWARITALSALPR